MESLDAGYWNYLMKLYLFQWQAVSGLFTLKMTQVSLESITLSQGMLPSGWGYASWPASVRCQTLLTVNSLCFLLPICISAVPVPCLFHFDPVRSFTLSAFPLVSSLWTFPPPNCAFTQEKKTINLLWYLRSRYTLCWRNFQKCLFLSPFSSL